MEFQFTDLPLDIHILISSHLSPQDFLNLKMISWMSRKIYDSIDYFGEVDYQNIKNIKNISKFKRLKINKLPEKSISEILENIKPIYVHLYMGGSPCDERIQIPDSVVDLEAYELDLYLDPIRNSSISKLFLFDVSLTGKISKTVKDLSVESLSYEIEDPSTIISLLIWYIPDYDLFIKSVIPSMSRLKILSLTLGGEPEEYVHKIPDLPTIEKISLNFPCRGDIILDFNNNPNVKFLEISSVSQAIIQNPPCNLSDYYLHLHGVFGSSGEWNASLNISAKKVTLRGSGTFEYVPDKNVERVILNGNLSYFKK